MKIKIYKTISGWSPYDEEGQSYHRKFKLNDVYHLNVSRFKDQRNVQLNAKYWKMLSVVLENQEKYHTKEQLHILAKRVLGVLEEIYNPIMDKITFEIGSTSFEKMNEISFQKFYKDALTFFCRYVVVGASPEEIDRRVEELLPFF